VAGEEQMGDDGHESIALEVGEGVCDRAHRPVQSEVFVRVAGRGRRMLLCRLPPETGQSNECLKGL
jgi:hypothetical protein